MMVPTKGIGSTKEHAELLIKSYKKWTGRDLIHIQEDKSLVEQLFHSPNVILSHGTEEDPILNFGNLATLELWEMEWDTLTQTPSRLTAEPMERADREKFLKEVTENGYVDNYTGIRISSTGKRFYIENATVWNLVDDEGNYNGQAATFASYKEC